MDDTQQITRSTTTQTGGGESKVGTVSVRGIICMMVFGSVCFREVALVLYTVWTSGEPIPIQEPFYGLVLLTAGYYFGQKSQPTQSSQVTTTTTPTP